MPFPIRAVQVDGEAEFHAAFEAECQRRGLRLFVLPPRSCKLNGAVDRAQRTNTEEFYEIRPFSDSSVATQPRGPRLGARLRHRPPHQALGYRTPLEFRCGASREASPSRLNRPPRRMRRGVAAMSAASRP
jgi:putative transposase